MLQKKTGVQRFASELIKAFDRNLEINPSGNSFEILLPPNSSYIEDLKVIKQRRVGCLKKYLTVWEQLELPYYSKDGTLLCLSGSAPLFAKDCIPTIHDAAVFLHGYAYSLPFIYWYRVLFRIRSKLSRLVLTVSTSSSNELKKHLPETNIKIVYNSAEHIKRILSDNSVLTNLKIEKHKFILAVGSHNQTKNFKRLIQAYTSSAFLMNLPLVIVGGFSGKVFKSEIIEYDCKNVIWAGSVTDESLRVLYEKALFLVFPSIYEGFGIPPLEAMHCGCPVVASNVSSIKEVCGDSVVYFDPLSIESISNALFLMISNEKIRDEFAKIGRMRANCYTWEKSANMLRDALIEFKYIN